MPYCTLEHNKKITTTECFFCECYKPSRKYELTRCLYLRIFLRGVKPTKILSLPGKDICEREIPSKIANVGKGRRDLEREF